MKLLMALSLAAISLWGQKDFLTTDEADQIRLAQEPNVRLQVYLQFARQRLDLIEQAIKKEKAGRSGLIHEYLEEYTQIIEAIDIVIDDSLKRKAVLDEGVAAVVKVEKDLLAKLEAFRSSNPPDIDRYRFALEQAEDTTRDSLEMAQEDFATRAADAAQREQQQRKEVEELQRPIDPEAAKPVEKQTEAEKKATDAAKPPRKPPTLRRKGETPPPAKP